MEIILTYTSQPLYLRIKRATAQIEFVAEWPPVLPLMTARRETPLAFSGNRNIIFGPQTCSKGAEPTAVPCV
jgi:hypothetical protein